MLRELPRRLTDPDTKKNFVDVPFFKFSDPFPLLQDFSYGQAKAHAEAVDSWLGLNIHSIERLLLEKGCRLKAPSTSKEPQELWIGLDPSRLLTPYLEIRSLLSMFNLKKGHKVVDLGAGYGRMAFVIARHYPEVVFRGYEYVGERVHEGKIRLAQFASRNCFLEHTDLTLKSFKPADADIYFIYDYGKPHAIEKTLHDLAGVARRHPISVVGRGRLCRDIIERQHPWLSQVIRPVHLGNSSIYRTSENSI